MDSEPSQLMFLLFSISESIVYRQCQRLILSRLLIKSELISACESQITIKVKIISEPS